MTPEDRGGLSGRSIPACAGEPRRIRRSPGSGRVYPRVCGGTNGNGAASVGVSGLSPRVRGNPHHDHQGLQGPGSIPACAGEPSPRSSRCAGSTVYPACAGEPGGSTTPRGSTRVYPRVCGGTASVGAAVCSQTGLSPRVRGNPPVLMRRVRQLGSIPACAGEPPTLPRCGVLHRVYPRVCGGTGSVEPAVRGVWGLSPRVRGNLCVRMTPAGSRPRKWGLYVKEPADTDQPYQHRPGPGAVLRGGAVLVFACCVDLLGALSRPWSSGARAVPVGVELVGNLGP